MGGLEGVDLFEEIKVAFVAPFEGLISFFATENLDGALDERGIREREPRGGWMGAPLANMNF